MVDLNDNPIEILKELKDELFEGSWEQMKEELEARLNRKPMDSKLEHRLKKDIELIEEAIIEKVH